MNASPTLSRRAVLSLAGLPWIGTTGCATAVRPVREARLVARAAPAAIRGSPHPAVAAWTYDGLVPGPVLRAPQGSTLRVTVDNQLPQDTTVHWHGVRVPNAMDGVPHLTQAPIAPGGRFTYEFPLHDAGTYWYHSHHRSAEQVERGLYGALVVDEPEPPRVDRDLLWVLDDWRLAPSGELRDDFLHPMDVSHAGRIGNVVTVNGQAPAPVPVRAGERLRLRLINAANARIFALVFDGHAPQVIAIDGQPVAPHVPAQGRVVLAPGMRTDLILDATGTPGRRYAVGDVFYPRSAYDLLEFAYADRPLRETLLATPVRLAPNPLAEPEPEGAALHTFRFEGGMMGSLHSATLDGRSVDMRTLLRAGKAWAMNGHVAGGHHMPPALTLPRGRTARLVFANDTRWHHPMHLHGHTFRVLSRNGEPAPLREWQDTVLVAPDERVEVAFVADNPGDWMLHCHVLEHQEGGMMATVRVG